MCLVLCPAFLGHSLSKCGLKLNDSLGSTSVTCHVSACHGCLSCICTTHGAQARLNSTWRARHHASLVTKWRRLQLEVRKRSCPKPPIATCAPVGGKGRSAERINTCVHPLFPRRSFAHALICHRHACPSYASPARSVPLYV